MSLAKGPSKPPVGSVCLVVLDGWGLAEPGPANAVSQAQTPVFNELWDGYPHTQLAACGRAVGLPDGQMGNSEVGHLNLGAGSIVRQDLARIDDAIADGSFARNEVLDRLCEAGRRAGRLHLLGLVSDGGVHSSFEHLRALIALCSERGPADVCIHAFTDGRDTPPDSGAGHLAELEHLIEATAVRVGTVCGRYYAMDRDRRWERTKRCYDAVVHGISSVPAADSGEDAVRAAYERGETDEFIQPTLVDGDARIRPQDAVLFFNFRPDRARQLTRALAERDFEEFDRGQAPVGEFATLTRYQEDWPYPAAFGPEPPETTLAAFLGREGISQLHVAETEKYGHVTYFFNGGEEDPYSGEKRVLVPSPREVATYDQKPEMSAFEAAAAFVEAWSSDRYGFGIINFANCDMVGHTGVFEAAVAAVEAVDECLGQVVEAVHAAGGACVITADHGNADHMLDADGSINTAHSLNPVPFIVTCEQIGLRGDGVLANVVPTVLDLLGLTRPKGMHASSLLIPR